MPQQQSRRSASPAAAGTGGDRSGGGRRRPHARGSNSARVADLGHSGPQPGADGDLDAIFDFVIAGDFDAARSSASSAAEGARATGDEALARQAGLVWQVADAFDKAQDAMAEKRFEAAKGHATHAAAQSRALLPTGAVEADDLQLAITSAGQAWELARTAAEQAVKDRRGRPTEMMDQHQLPHWNNGAFCGIAVMIMMLRANGMEQGSSTADLDALARRVYISGKGTSGSAMSGVLRERGIQDSRFTTTGTQATLIQSLEKGQTVPFGVTSVEGTVTRLEGGSSHRYNRRVGDPHQRKFRGAGHWVLVTGYEGTPERPTAFFVNDPDLGGELRCTPMQISRMGEGSGSFYLVHQ